MKYIKSLFLLSITLLLLTGCGNKKYVGYWCKYEETGTIIVTLNEDNTKKQRESIEKVISNFTGLSSYDYVPKENFTAESTTDGEAFDTYFIYFMDTTTIDEHTMALEKLDGVKKVEENNVKTNVSLYQFVDSKNYKFQDGIGVEDDLKVKGTYKINENAIQLTSPANTTTLYIKNDYLCADTACNIIYTKTDDKCEKIAEK